MLAVMRIRTIDGPPLPAEITEQAARAIALTTLQIVDQARSEPAVGGRSGAACRPVH